MAFNKNTKNDDFEEENILSNSKSKKSDDEDEYYENPKGDGIDREQKESMIETLFNTKDRLIRTFKSWRGETLNKNNTKPLAGNRFLNTQISAMAAVIDTTNGISRKTDLECKRILHDAVEAEILDMVNDPTMRDIDMRTFSKIYEHSLELFLGLVEYGHGSKVLKDVSAGLNTPEEQKEEKKGLFSSLLGK